MTISFRHLTAAAFSVALLWVTAHSKTAEVIAPVLTAAGAATCESLLGLKLPNATVTTAQTVAAGAFTPPAALRGAGAEGRGAAPAIADAGAGRGRAGAAAQITQRLYGSLPSFCRVAATLTPSSDSDIKIEVWLPAASAEGSGEPRLSSEERSRAAGWNGKFQAVGNGGWAGVISYTALAQAVAEGYATASTDTGHVGGTAAFAVGHPEKVIDMGYRAVHEMTVQSKAIVDAFYGTAPSLSLWNGCSQGGRQGITSAQRYPADFDAIVAGAPAVNLMRLHGARMAINLQAQATPENVIPPAKYAAIHDAVLEACDANDGVKDGVLEDPTRCRFDPKVLECKGPDGPACLTKPQVETARALYAPVRHPRTGEVTFPTLLERGSELGWATLAGPQPVGTALDAFRYVVFQDAAWDWRRFNAATDVAFAEKLDGGVLNSGVVNLKPYFDRGGKLLMYHGWSDQQVSPGNTVDYFSSVVRATSKGSVGKSIQLYMVPGMGHCQGGPGTDRFDKMQAIEQWVSTGKAPESIVAAHYTGDKIDRKRPLCPYGKVAKWKGTGSTDEAENFACVTP